MNLKDLNWCIDTLTQEEELLYEFKRYLRRTTDTALAVAVDGMARQISSVRVMLETERTVLTRIRKEK